MNQEFKTRLFSFIWRWGAFVGVALGAYVMNISDIRAIDMYKLTTIFVVVTAGYIFNEGTKYLNSSAKDVVEDVKIDNTNEDAG